MSKRNIYHVVPHGNQWIGRLVGTTLPVVVSYNKEEAVRLTVEEAKRTAPSSVIIHKADGTIEDERTYGNDPFPPRG